MNSQPNGLNPSYGYYAPAAYPVHPAYYAPPPQVQPQYITPGEYLARPPPQHQYRSRPHSDSGDSDAEEPLLLCPVDTCPRSNPSNAYKDKSARSKHIAKHRIFKTYQCISCYTILEHVDLLIEHCREVHAFHITEADAESKDSGCAIYALPIHAELAARIVAADELGEDRRRARASNRRNALVPATTPPSFYPSAPLPRSLNPQERVHRISLAAGTSSDPGPLYIPETPRPRMFSNGYHFHQEQPVIPSVFPPDEDLVYRRDVSRAYDQGDNRFAVQYEDEGDQGRNVAWRHYQTDHDARDYVYTPRY